MSSIKALLNERLNKKKVSKNAFETFIWDL
jgi:hypothetical protein